MPAKCWGSPQWLAPWWERWHERALRTRSRAPCLYLGTAFLAVRSWALDGMRTTCLVSAGLSVTAGLLFGIAIVGTLNPAARFFTLTCTASSLIWAIVLLWLARELGKPEYRQKFQAGAS